MRPRPPKRPHPAPVAPSIPQLDQHVLGGYAAAIYADLGGKAESTNLERIMVGMMTQARYITDLSFTRMVTPDSKGLNPEFDPWLLRWQRAVIVFCVACKGLQAATRKGRRSRVVEMPSLEAALAAGDADGDAAPGMPPTAGPPRNDAPPDDDDEPNGGDSPLAAVGMGDASPATPVPGSDEPLAHSAPCGAESGRGESPHVGQNVTATLAAPVTPATPAPDLRDPPGPPHGGDPGPVEIFWNFGVPARVAQVAAPPIAPPVSPPVLEGTWQAAAAPHVAVGATRARRAAQARWAAYRQRKKLAEKGG